MKIGIYGGSFNPIHKGHIEIANYAITSLKLDKLIFVPAHKSPFKKKETYESNHDRLEMIKLVLGQSMEVSDFELNRKGTSYSIDTIKYFKQKFPNDELFFIIGSDHLYKLHKWKNVDEITDLAKIVVFKRSSAFSKINIRKYDCMLMNNPIYNYSSHAFRDGDFSQIDEKVSNYIGAHYLYVNELVKNMTKPMRYKHCLATGRQAAKYAKQVGEDPKKAWLAGTFHDITKNWTIQKHRLFINEYGLNEKDYEDYELHSLTGSLWIKEVYKVNDEKIISSIRKHTLLANDLTTFDKIIFAADKLAEGRNHSGVQQERKLIKDDFESGFKNLVRNTFNSLKSIGRNIKEDQVKVYKDIFEKE